LSEHPGRCLCVVMPCYNESATVREVAERVLASPYTAELVVVDDGSTDGTPEILAELRDPRVKVLLQPVNRGKGAALRRGVSEATADFVIVQDADLEYDPADFERVLGPLLAGQADVVFGSRFLAGQPHRVLYFWHSVGNRVLTTVSNMFTNLNLTDMETCYKAFRREVIQSFTIEEDRFGFEPEITAKVATGGWRVYEVGISYAGRTYAEGKKIGWRDGLRAMYCIVRYSRPAGRGAPVGRRGPAPAAAATPAPAAFEQADEALQPTLETLDGAVNYTRWIHDLVRPYLGPEVLEVGAGDGTFTEMLVGADRVVATDLSPRCVTRLRERFAGRGVDVLEADVASSAASGRYDSVVLINVLEHVEDDGLAVKQLAAALRPGGCLILWVPAFSSLYSDFDRRIGHQRRYRVAGLTALLDQAGLEVAEARYVNPVGGVAWWLLAKQLGRDPVSGANVKLFDRVAVPVLRRLGRVDIGFGQSVLCVGRRPGPADDGSLSAR